MEKSGCTHLRPLGHFSILDGMFLISTGHTRHPCEPLSSSFFKQNENETFLTFFQVLGKLGRN